ncbi:MAG TPA: hypothetical protein VMR76_02150, partial [Candidatus Saccharimonadia bacterium]|nr:hypothetical protein [Candidatus Saccharimonadia bacterium]
TIDINYLLPLTSNGSGFSYGSLSDNCYDFVKSTPLEASIIATWENINFLCDLPTHIADVVGTGSVGQPINESVATGTYDGTHKYFFEYTDDSIQPDYSYLYSAIDNFSAR